ncbi:MAG: 1-deoxy-D-xylulose-5-phosphate reductoisomerase [Bacteroidaceae bacterium]|nr:1-deoxy-D-xylulose-5-phosphate reductoisomerase [Bacteroidaceae bacterium]
MKRIAILGSTGSIGRQTLDIVREHPDQYEAFALTALSSAELLIAQAREFRPEVVVIADESHYDTVSQALADLPIKVFAGTESICDVVRMSHVDIVVTAMVGFSGLRPTIAAIEAGKTIALANKETLVVAGEIITQLAVKHRVSILPVDSEHSAIFQCLVGEDGNDIERLLLTASGGPFRTFTPEQLEQVTAAQALCHPNWEMGAKITIDSATMMNKGFEMIEAKWLFGIEPSAIEVVVHPESIVHSAVQFADGSVKAQLGVPDMRLPIQYALSFPQRLPLSGERLDLFALRSLTFERVHSAVQFADGSVKAQLGVPDMRLPIQYALSFPQRLSLSGERLDLFALRSLTFERPDFERFDCLAIAYEAAAQGGDRPCVVNAANEVANLAFRQGKIGLLDIPRTIRRTLDALPHLAHPTLDDIFAIDLETRRIAQSLC